MPYGNGKHKYLVAKWFAKHNGKHDGSQDHEQIEGRYPETEILFIFFRDLFLIVNSAAPFYLVMIRSGRISRTASRRKDRS